ncbi:hypothetical protein Mapa_014523 [Marchantia paleacea]|nr:hypothetical protein Mapa_014523 [Marchantia paleacea]
MEEKEEQNVSVIDEAMGTGEYSVLGGVVSGSEWAKGGIVKVVKDRLQVCGTESYSLEATREGEDDMASVCTEAPSTGGLPSKFLSTSSPFLKVVADNVIEGRESDADDGRERGPNLGIAIKASNGSLSNCRDPVWSNLFPEKASQQRLKKLPLVTSVVNAFEKTAEIFSHAVDSNTAAGGAVQERLSGSKSSRKLGINAGTPCERVYRRRQRSLKDLSLHDNICSNYSKGGVGTFSNALTSTGIKAGETGLSVNSPPVKVRRKAKVLPNERSIHPGHSRLKWTPKDVSVLGQADNSFQSADVVSVPGIQRQSTLDQLWKQPAVTIACTGFVKNGPKEVHPVEIFVSGISRHDAVSGKSKRKMAGADCNMTELPPKGNVFPVIPLDNEALPRKRQKIWRGKRGSKAVSGLSCDEFPEKSIAEVGRAGHDGLSSSAKVQVRKRLRQPVVTELQSSAIPDCMQTVPALKKVKYSGESACTDLVMKLTGKKQVPRIRKDGRPDERFKQIGSVCVVTQSHVSVQCDQPPVVEDERGMRLEESTSKVFELKHPAGFRKDGKPDERFKCKKAGPGAADCSTQPWDPTPYLFTQGKFKNGDGIPESSAPEGSKLNSGTKKSIKPEPPLILKEKLATAYMLADSFEGTHLTQDFRYQKRSLDSAVLADEVSSKQEKRFSLGTRKDGRPDERFKRRDNSTISAIVGFESFGQTNNLNRGKRTKYKPLSKTAVGKHEQNKPLADDSTGVIGSDMGGEASNDSKVLLLERSQVNVEETKRMKQLTEVAMRLSSGTEKKLMQVSKRRCKKSKEYQPDEPAQVVGIQDANITAAMNHVKKLPEVQKNGVRKPKRVQLKRLFVDNPDHPHPPVYSKLTNSRVVKSLWSPPKQMKHIAEPCPVESSFAPKSAKSTKFLSLQQLDRQEKLEKPIGRPVLSVKEISDQLCASEETISDCPLAMKSHTPQSSLLVMDDRHQPRNKQKVGKSSSHLSTVIVSSKEHYNLKTSTSDQPVLSGPSEKRQADFGEVNPGVRMTPRTRKLTDAMQNFLLQKATLLQQWKEMELGKIHPSALIGRSCKIFWPLDSEWYPGVIHEYNPQTRKHRIDYEDDEREWVLLGKERVKLYVSAEESKALEISFGEGSLMGESKKLNADELAVLAAGIEDYGGELSHGDLVWAKVKGYPMWPAFVMDEEHAIISGLEPASRERTVPVQFFGSYDHARISCKKAMQFSRGIMHKYHTKCKRTVFEQGLQEVERYLKECKLPESMIQLQEDVSDIAKEKIEGAVNPEESEEDADFGKDEKSSLIKKNLECPLTMPLKLGGLQVLCLGKIVRDSEQFHNEHHIWTDGYSAVRKFTSIKDPQKLVDYKMEIERNPTMRSLPLFRVSPEDGKPVEGPSASACWKRILIKIQRVKEKAGLCEATLLEKKRQSFRSGPSLFGFGNRRVAKLIQTLPYARVCSKFTAWIEKPLLEDGAEEPLPAGYRPVEFRWKHLDRCSVCYLDEEYADNQLLQCDKCRIMVHMYCYGEPEAPDGDLWLCNLCRPGAPRNAPFCCLCPVTGGAMKTTTDGRWAHITCAMWTPETCLVDVKRMEPVDGISAINKERWKLVCTVCKVPYGACIQCSKPHCRVSFHPLCARAAGLSMEVMEDKAGSVPDSDGGLQLLTYCKKHKPAAQGGCIKPQSQQHVAAARIVQTDCPQPSSSGCARGEPYNSALRRGHREPEALAAALRKRSFVQNMPYIVTGCMRSPPDRDSKGFGGSLWSFHWKQSRISNAVSTEGPQNEDEIDNGKTVLSMSERFRHMKSTMHQRLTFGKSAIHGWGVFTKRAHCAGDMVIEYAGEIVRPIIADIRERRSYDSLVGAGTYMFRIDDERVVDATHAGSIAHLINHSCEPNCYSRVVAASGEDHIIIFAKRDIPEGVELTYDYRFASKDELLTCYCGCTGCRGSVNSFGSEEEPTRITAPRSELTKWIV